ncbi:anthranilate synthase component I family protein [Mucilaginibacter jinjuensis]|uniref:Anthranilate synthase component I family protein n=1 Tax=Mucilaginibacter jinjuensis TaxID=1176721 RepID=A0ABY7TCC9_9SPHI|nr:anthranilate synthase component I family protein [Mucilaginibacter jinjuensis]WCT13976.1 anthranilate synthase component I family protein [Mucilaginibacter jinjuensis]
MIFHPNNIHQFKQNALHWGSTFDVCCYLDSNNFKDSYSKFDTLIAIGTRSEVTAQSGNAFEALANFKAQHNEWMTGFLGYDLKNEIEAVNSANPDHLQFPDLYFFVPQHLIIINGDEVDIQSDDAEIIFQTINAFQPKEEVSTSVNIQTRFNRTEYIDTVNEIKAHINRGDIYVTNFCQEFYAEDASINPVHIFQKLNEASPNPFACFFKYHQQYIICASPERFLAKRDNKLISQPIKGTAKRGLDEASDNVIIQQLRSNPKEQQENVMIVDLVRNDLTRSAVAGTVKVEELFGIYSFKQVHQMISTVVCELDQHISTVKALRNTFPMGSMTGAPKVSAMQLMEHYERTKRGVYSGAVGYFSPDGDFDFNVVIRSILYNEIEKYLSFQAGSAITYHADAAFEYEECLLKVKAIMEVLGQN